MTEATVYRFEKNSRESVLARLTNYRGLNLADLRVHVAGVDGQPRPTPKGIAVRVEDLPKLLEAVQALIAAGETRAA